MELELSLQQKQILSQRMQLSVKILQMNALDLEQYLRDTALENPLIELEFPEEQVDEGQDRLKKLEWLEEMDDSNIHQYPIRRDENQSEMPLYEKNPVDSLYDILLAQLPGLRLPSDQEKTVRYLIENLDENGYLACGKDQLAAHLGIGEPELDDALAMLHRLDPPGVGAEDLRECLLIQARRMEEQSPVLIELIENHLDVLAKNQLSKLAKSLHVTIDQVKEARELLLTLNPKPGNGYSSYKSIPYIRPDLFIVRFEDSFQVILNSYNQPKIEINRYYRTLAKDAGSEAAAYIGDKLNKAEWLITCIRQRNATILKCAGTILERQMRFFEHGPGNLMPLTLADVAEAIEMHPSTISRAIRGKYLQCQWGVFGLSDFFSRSVSDQREDQSQDMVLNQIRRIIEEEDRQKPFSDQEIAARLEQHGIHIARRTVAKYREQLGIATASGRKEY